MAYDLDEQEKLAELKAWWNQYGNLVVAVLLGVVLAFAGWQGWRWYETNQLAQASVHYDNLTKAVQAGEAKAMRDSAGALAENHARTPYASMGALVAARFYFDRNDLKSAKAQLQWIIERSSSSDFRDLARLRLAAVLLDEQSYDEALKQLEATPGPAYEAHYAALRGDILAAKNQGEEAKAAYKLALDKAQNQDGAFRESVLMRLEGLGG
jgi:predicted negative regulator of RcsB-dependent stress response